MSPPDLPAVERERMFHPPVPQAAVPRKRRAAALLHLVLWVPLWLVLGFGFGALIAKAPAWLAIGIPGLDGGWAVFVMAAAAVLSIWPHIIVHEAGHALAGLWRGMHPMAIGVGALRWENSQVGWRYRKGKRVAGIGGFAIMLPNGERGLSRFDQFAYLLGGPLANLATAAVLLGAAYIVPSPPWLATAMTGAAAMALLLGTINLLPFETQGWRTDGKGMLGLLRNSPDAMLQQHLLQLMALNMSGIRPRNWPPALVPPVGTPGARPSLLQANADMLQLSWAMDSGDDTAAGHAASALIARYPALPAAFQPHVAICVAGFVARTLHDLDALRAWRPLCEGGISNLGFMRDWLDAEIAVLANSADADTRIQAARESLTAAPDPVTALLLGEYLETLSGRQTAAAP